MLYYKIQALLFFIIYYTVLIIEANILYLPVYIFNWKLIDSS